ncbi:MAG: hypothetical protein M3336_14190 [Chloroflexota bacterium]|nr:hypothetical protein [Chloroflexota bacterium]
MVNSMRLVHTTDGTWLAWARLYLHLFRIVVVSTCAFVAAYAWLADIGWLLAAAACIGTGELLECSYYLMVLRWGERSRRLR